MPQAFCYHNRVYALLEEGAGVKVPEGVELHVSNAYLSSKSLKYSRDIHGIKRLSQLIGKYQIIVFIGLAKGKPVSGLFGTVYPQDGNGIDIQINSPSASLSLERTEQ